MKNILLFLFLAGNMLVSSSCKNKEDDSEAHFTKGNNLVLNGDFANAKVEFDLSIKSDPRNWKANYQLAGVYELEGDLKNAM